MLPDSLRFSPLLTLFLLSAVVSLGLAGYVARREGVAGGDRLVQGTVTLLAAAGLWSLTYLFRLANAGLDAKLAWLVAEYAVSWLVPVGWLVVALSYADREAFLTRRRAAALTVLPGVTVVLVATNHLHHLVWAAPELVRGGSLVVLDRTWGPWLYVHVAYNYAVILAGAVLFARTLRTTTGPYRGQVAALLGMVVAPLAGNVGFLFDLGGASRIEYTAAGFTVTGLLLVLALFRYRFLDLAPVGYSAAVEAVADPYVVLDRERQVVAMNPAAREAFGADGTPVGAPAGAVLPFDVSARTAGATDGPTREVTAIEGADGTRYFDALVAPIRDEALLGWTVVLRETTERYERERRLERQNERLEEFASVVSHDLRNPLNVARGHHQLARDTGDPEHHDALADALDRMEAIVEDTLALVREGNPVTETEAVSLAAAARHAWGTVETGRAELEVAADTRLLADSGRLRTVLENLFRNSVEHGSTSPASQARRDSVEHGSTGGRTQSDDGPETGSPGGEGLPVRVGPLPDGTGFYVEDDGTGIPPDRREEALSVGYSTSEAGTGFGLHIVEQVADAHGWSLEITESDAGGARFEFVGVDTLERSAPVEREAG